MVHDTAGDAMKRTAAGRQAYAIFAGAGLASPADGVLRQPRTRRVVRRPDRRTRSILAAAAAAALVVNAGAGWFYWKITAGRATGTAVEMALHASSDDNKPLTPGRTGNLTVMLTNDSDFPIRISRVTVPPGGRTAADEAHRDDGCDPSGVTPSRDQFSVDWRVPKNTIGAFTIPDGLMMAAGAEPECTGASFTTPIRVSGVSQPQ